MHLGASQRLPFLFPVLVLSGRNWAVWQFGSFGVPLKTVLRVRPIRPFQGGPSYSIIPPAPSPPTLPPRQGAAPTSLPALRQSRAPGTPGRDTQTPGLCRRAPWRGHRALALLILGILVDVLLFFYAKLGAPHRRESCFSNMHCRLALECDTRFWPTRKELPAHVEEERARAACARASAGVCVCVCVSVCVCVCVCFVLFSLLAWANIVQHLELKRQTPASLASAARQTAVAYALS